MNSFVSGASSTTFFLIGGLPAFEGETEPCNGFLAPVTLLGLLLGAPF